MKYEEAIKIMTSGDRDELDRGDILIREMCRLTNDLLDYRYTVQNYKGDQNGIYSDKVGSIKNTLAILLGDVDMYMEYMDITDKVNKKKESRVIKLAEKKER